MKKKQNIEQNINVTGSSNVKIEQIAGDKKNQNYKTHSPFKITHSPTDDFFNKKQEIIEELAQKFCTYINRDSSITGEDIKKWLIQFGEVSRIELGLKLLEGVDYYSSQRMQEMFCHFRENVMRKDDRDKAVISLLGDLKDSSSMVNYIIGEKTMEYNLEAQPLEAILNNMNPNEKAIVFVDDNIGSGKQALRIFHEWLGIEDKELNEKHVKPLSKVQIEKFKQFKIYISTFVGFENGKGDVAEELKRLGLNICDVYSFNKLEEKIGCFHPASDIFADQKEREEAENMAKEIGIQLFSGKKHWPDELKTERSLGYGNSQKLIVFFYNTPTSTLPILWKKGTYNGEPWEPLFPRREKK